MDILYSKQAVKFLDKLTPATRERIITAIENLPYGDIKRLQGREGYRLRVGNFRVLFDKDGHVISVQKIENRGQVYK